MIAAEVADRLIRVHVERLEKLRQREPDDLIVCDICHGTAPEPQFCGCDGWQTVAEAIRHHEFEIEILSK